MLNTEFRLPTFYLSIIIIICYIYQSVLSFIINSIYLFIYYFSN